MTTAEDRIEGDDKDWTWVLDRSCPECGFDASALAATDVADRVRAQVPVWDGVLARSGARERPDPHVWSPLEYGCHVRDLCVVTGRRLDLMLAADGARFENWDQDASAVAERYAEQDPPAVATQFAAAATAVADRLDNVQPAQWRRRGLRSNGSAFTVDSLSRYALHDLLHHAWDVGAGQGRPRPR